MSLLADVPPHIDFPATRLTFGTDSPEFFDFLLQEPFRVPCYEGCTVREFLCILMQICGDYAETRIQTIFLNGKPVDDFDVAVLHGDDRLALSAAMPGLVGATMRRGGFYAKMRGSISHHGEQEQEHGRPCLVLVRLFNFLARELAERFLTAGIYVNAERFRELLAARSHTFFDALRDLRLDGEAVSDAHDLARLLSDKEPQDVFLQLRGADA